MLDAVAVSRARRPVRSWGDERRQVVWSGFERDVGNRVERRWFSPFVTRQSDPGVFRRVRTEVMELEDFVGASRGVTRRPGRSVTNRRSVPGVGNPIRNHWGIPCVVPLTG